MVGVVVAAHGTFAQALVDAAEGIAGKLDNLRVVNLLAHEGLEIGTEKIASAVQAVDRGAGVILLADLFGGTPSNCCLSLLQQGKLEVVTGVNLPMLIKLAQVRDSPDLIAVAREVREIGRNAIWVASDLLHAEAKA